MSEANRVINGTILGIGAATFLAAGAARSRPAGPVGVCPNLVRALVAKTNQLQADNADLAAQVESLSLQLDAYRSLLR